jgi:hypothetical protein
MATADPAAASVHDPYITFVQGVSQQTGIDPRVLVAWIKQEGAYAPNGTKGFNFLNLRPYAGDPYSGVSSGGFEQFSGVQDAITATVRRINQPFASGIRASVGKTPQESISAIAASGWDAAHYGGPGGPNLVAAFTGLFNKAALSDSYLSPASAGGVAAAAGTGSAADAGSSDLGVGGAVKSIGGAITAVPDFLGKITSLDFLLRAGEVIGGAILILAGLYLLAKQIGLATPTVPGPSGLIAQAV